MGWEVVVLWCWLCWYRAWAGWGGRRFTFGTCGPVVMAGLYIFIYLACHGRRDDEVLVLVVSVYSA